MVDDGWNIEEFAVPYPSGHAMELVFRRGDG